MRLTVLLAGASLIATSANAVVVVNGSFELGLSSSDPTLQTYGSKLIVAGDKTSITGWKVEHDSVDLVTTAWDASDGSRSLDLSGVNPGGVLQSIHGLTYGQSYIVTFDMSGSYADPVRTSPNVMGVLATGNAAQYYSFDKANTIHDMMYETETYTFVAHGTSAVLRFDGQDAGDYGAVLDNVRVDEVGGGGLPNPTVPEPATWAMMLGGFGLTGWAMRRRQGNVLAA